MCTSSACAASYSTLDIPKLHTQEYMFIVTASAENAGQDKRDSKWWTATVAEKRLKFMDEIDTEKRFIDNEHKICPLPRQIN